MSTEIVRLAVRRQDRKRGWRRAITDATREALADIGDAEAVVVLAIGRAGYAAKAIAVPSADLREFFVRCNQTIGQLVSVDGDAEDR